MNIHREAELDGVVVLPWTTQREIATLARKDGQGTSIDLHASTIGPVWNTQTDGNIRRLLWADRELCALLPRKIRILPQFQLLLRPAHFRGHIQVHVDRVIVVKINRIV